jgi:hypothetical protein
MPYLTQKRRDELKASGGPQTPGELNYAITMLLIEYWYHNPLPGNYTRANDISGACTEALAEFRRRVIVPYELTKIEENGDVYY